MPGKNYGLYQSFTDPYVFVNAINLKNRNEPETPDAAEDNFDFLAALMQRKDVKVVFEDGSTVNPAIVKEYHEKGWSNLRGLLDAHVESEKGTVSFSVLYDENVFDVYDEDNPAQNKRIFAIEVGKNGAIRGQLVNTPEEYMNEFPPANGPQKPRFLDYLVHIFKYLFGGDEVVNRYNSYMYDRAQKLGMQADQPRTYVQTHQPKTEEEIEQLSEMNNVRMQGIRFKVGTQYANAMPQDEIAAGEREEAAWAGRFDGPTRYVPFKGSPEAQNKVRIIEQDFETKRRAIQGKAIDVETGDREKDAEFRQMLDSMTMHELSQFNQDPRRTVDKSTFAVTNILHNLGVDQMRQLRTYFDKNGLAKTGEMLEKQTHPEKDAQKNSFRKQENAAENDGFHLDT